MIFTGVLNTVCAIVAVLAFPDPPAVDYSDKPEVLQLFADDSLTLALILQIVALLFQVGLCASVTGRLSRGLVGVRDERCVLGSSLSKHRAARIARGACGALSSTALVADGPLKAWFAFPIFTEGPKSSRFAFFAS